MLFCPSRARGRKTGLLRHIQNLHGSYYYRSLRPIVPVARHIRDFLHNLLAFHDLAEDGVAVIQPTCGRERNKELAAICTGARVGHGQLARLVELPLG